MAPEAFWEAQRVKEDIVGCCRPLIKKTPSFKGLNVRILIMIFAKGRGFINQGSASPSCPKVSFFQGVVHVVVRRTHQDARVEGCGRNIRPLF